MVALALYCPAGCGGRLASSRMLFWWITRNGPLTDTTERKKNSATRRLFPFLCESLA